MKKSVLFILMLCLLVPYAPAEAAAAVHSAYRLSFQGHLADVFPEPGGRWLDEFLDLLDLRAECISWESGSITRLDFIIYDMSAASLSVLELSDDMYLSGSLFPEVPLLFYEGQREAAKVFCETLFPLNGRPEDPGVIEMSVGELAEFIRMLAFALDQAAFSQESSMLTFIRLLGELAQSLSEFDPDAPALTVVRTADNAGEPEMENIQYTSDVAIERLLRALITAIAMG